MTKVSIIDMIAKKLRRCIAIVEDGDTASQAIASGKFVIWKGNPCKASTAISAGATLSNSNLTALSDGIGNELNGNIANIFKPVTNPTVEQLKQAKLIFVRCYNADGTGLHQTVTVDANSTKNQVAIEVWNGSAIQRTIGKIEWNKTNGTLTLSTEHSDRSTTLVMSNVVYMLF